MGSPYIHMEVGEEKEGEKDRKRKRKTKREIYLKVLAHMVVEAGKSEIHKVNQQAVKSGRMSVMVSWQNSLNSLRNLT